MIDLMQVARFAAWVYEGQVRKFTNRPYVSHCARLAARATLFFDDAELATVMWLHDGPEDAPERCPFSLIEALYGRRVAAGVLAMTSRLKQLGQDKDPAFSREARKRLDREWMAQQSREFRILKMMDRIDNLGEINVEMASEWARTYAEESRALVAELAGTHEGLEAELIGATVKIHRECDDWLQK